MGSLAWYRARKSSRSSICATVVDRCQPQRSSSASSSARATRVAAELDAVDVEHEPRLFEEHAPALSVDLLAVSIGRVSERPDGSPTRAVKSPTIRTATWPASWNCRSFRSTTAWPSVRSGRSGRARASPAAAAPRASFSSRPSLRDDLGGAAAQLDRGRRPSRGCYQAPPRQAGGQGYASRRMRKARGPLALLRRARVRRGARASFPASTTSRSVRSRRRRSCTRATAPDHRRCTPPRTASC